MVQMATAMAHEMERSIADDSGPIEMLVEPLHLRYATCCKASVLPATARWLF